MPPSKKIYWDSCVFIAWLKDEVRPGHEMDGVYECVEEVEAGRVGIFTAVTTVTEVLESKMTVAIKTKYTEVMNGRKVQFIPTDLRVGEKASELRDFYLKQSKIDGKDPLTQPDAIHLATAIHYRADEFWTFDNGGYGGRSLLSLDGNVAGYPLNICKPWATQLRIGTH